MRNIERGMLAALRDGVAWRSGNTRVTAREKVGNRYVARVYLHGNEIARVHYWSDSVAIMWPYRLEVSLAGWNTRTTRSRLTVLIGSSKGLGRWPDGCGVSTRKGQARLHHANGTSLITDSGWYNVALADENDTDIAA